MASKTRKVAINILKYSLSLGVASFLLWYVYRDLAIDSLLERFKTINYNWILLSLVLVLISHYLRAYRWNILLEPLGYKLKTSRTFIAVMVGYFVNNLVPRLGEVTRCGILKKNDNVSMTSAFGSVVAERVIDLLTLIILATITFIVEFDKLNQFVMDNFGDNIPNAESIYGMAYTAFGIFIVLGLLAFILFRVFRNKLHRNPIYLKFKSIIKDVLEGFLSVRKIQNPGGFWLSTLGIWSLYYFVPFVVFYAFPETSNLDFMAGLSILIMSGIGMSAPVQGGIGVFHMLVGGILVLYGVSLEEGKVFALVLHSTHFITIMVFGGISFIISVFMKKVPANAISE